MKEYNILCKKLEKIADKIPNSCIEENKEGGSSALYIDEILIVTFICNEVVVCESHYMDDSTMVYDIELLDDCIKYFVESVKTYIGLQNALVDIAEVHEESLIERTSTSFSIALDGIIISCGVYDDGVTANIAIPEGVPLTRPVINCINLIQQKLGTRVYLEDFNKSESLNSFTGR